MIRLILSAFALALTLVGAPAQAQDRRPLLMEGKERLFQRVLVRDRVPARTSPNGSATGAQLIPLEPLYVYARQDGWLEVGRNDAGGSLFWIPQDAAVDWKQQIVATFSGSENVGRALFFEGLDPLYDVVEAENPALAASGLRADALTAEEGGGTSETIVALGPRETVDQRTNLYVMPILDSEEAILESGQFVNLLEVAVARADPPGREAPEPIAASPEAAREDYRAAVVFVVDTTVSMQPYIERTRDALATIYRDVAASMDADAVSFGLVGYRDNLAGAADLEYDVKTFVPLQDGFSQEAFLNGISRMHEAESSSRNYREDSYRGIDHALRTLDWSGFGARFVVLVTNAGPREFDDDLSATGLSARGLATLIQDELRGVVSVLHLKTPDGANDHPWAESRYSVLASRENQAPLYFPVEDGDEARYRAEAEKLGRLIVRQVAAFRGGEEIEDFAEPADDPMAAAIRSAGRTMQLAYLGEVGAAEAPDVFEAFVADRDFERATLKPLEIRLLLNKNQLSDLAEALALVIDQAEANILDPTEFFDQVLGAAADMSRRPDLVSRRSEAASLAEAAFIEEYLEGLPYRSQIMNVSEDDWIRMSVPEHEAIVNTLYDKLGRYRRYNEASDQWVNYLGSEGGAALLYPMKLDDLP